MQSTSDEGYQIDFALLASSKIFGVTITLVGLESQRGWFLWVSDVHSVSNLDAQMDVNVIVIIGNILDSHFMANPSQRNNFENTLLI